MARAPLPPSQIVRVLDVLRQAEAVVEALASRAVTERGVVRLPPDGYPLHLIERDAIEQALQLANWVQKDAAALLGITGRVMHYKIRTHGIRAPRHARVRPWKIST